jgi:uncharacterized protein YqhQ
MEREQGRVPANKSRKTKKMDNKKPYVGGQAVIEGVMMRAPKSMAIAVRRENGQISLKEGVWHSIWDRLTFLRWPFLRGAVVMVEAMINGMQALNFSAKEAMIGEDENGKVKDESPGKLSMSLTFMVSILFAIGLFKFLPHMAASYAGFLIGDAQLTVDHTLYHVVDGIVKLGIFIAYIGIIGQLKDIARVFQYHGAEHMSIYTFEANEPLTVENARRKSRLHPRCGTAFIMVVILTFIVVAAALMPFLPAWAKPTQDGPWTKHLLVVLFKLPLLIPVAGIAYEFNRFAGKHCDSKLLKPFLWPGLAMQLLTTKRPTDDQLEVALASLRAVLHREAIGGDIADTDEPTIFENFDAFAAAYPLKQSETLEQRATGS